MIVDFLIKIFIWIVNIIDKIMPKWTFPESIINAWEVARDTLSLFNEIFPLNLAFTIFGLVLLFEIAILTIRFGGDIIALLRGSGKLEI